MEKQKTSVSELYPKRALLIINPVSGKKAVIRFIPQIIRELMDGGYLVNTMVTSRRGEATDFAKEIGGEYDLVCCTGGDGTLNEVVTGLIQGGISVDVGYVPCGSTNDFAISHGLSTDIPTAAHNASNGDTRRYDVGRFGDDFFTYVAAFGAFSWISYMTDQNLKNVLGHNAYIFEGIKNFYKIKPIHIKLTANGEVHEDDYIFGALCNSTSVAGLITLPDSIVKTDDGLFEVMLIKMPKSIFDLDLIIRGVLNKDYSCPLIDFFQTESVDIETSEEIEWALDGERGVADGHIHASLLPRFLRLKG